MNFCTKCGSKVSEDVNFCPTCGQQIVEAQETVQALPPQCSPTKSLSSIVIMVFCALGIFSLLINGYFEYWSKSTTGGYGNPFTKKANFFELFDSSVPGIFAIIIFATILILAIVGIKGAKKPLSWFSFGLSCGGFLFILISSIIGKETFYYYNSGITTYGVYYTSTAEFLNFGILFYITLLVFVLIAIFSLFDALEKPLIKARQNEASRETAENSEDK